ncbi:(S)-benzoin forming benzil reductase [Neobacillus sp. Marseille-QA0830]
MKYAIITGASKGLGEAIARRLMTENVAVISVSRTENQELKTFALEQGVKYKHFPCNLSLETEVQEVFMEISHIIFQKEPKEILLFNNAGLIEPIHTVGNLEPSPVIRNIQVNLIAPMVITNLLISRAPMINATVQVVNVTSGAAIRPKEGWSAYCSAKAGLLMFTQTAAMEQETLNTPHKLIAFEPGIMDTQMQETIRSSSIESFKELERFKAFKNDNLLRTPEIVTEALVRLVLSGKAVNGKVYNIKELLQ